MATPLSSAQEHQILTASIPVRLFPIFFQNKLQPLLPYSLPLYRRCQYHLYDLSLKENSELPPAEPGQPELWVAVAFPAQSLLGHSQSWLDQWLNSPHPKTTIDTNTNAPTATDNEGQIWLAEHIDLREPGQTQIWTFGSWESKLAPMTMASSSTAPVTITPTPIQIRLARAFFSRLRTHHVPSCSRTPSQQYLIMKAAGKIVSSPYKRSKIIFGTIAEASWWMLEDGIISNKPQPSRDQADPVSASGSQLTRKATTRQDKPYLKYILQHPLAPSSSSSPDYQMSLTLSPLQTKHLQTVLDRSPIPRTLELLRSLVTIGLFPEDAAKTSPDPVAWGILSKDASIGSLHTEPEFRGKGLAEVVVRELMKEEEKWFRDSWITETGTETKTEAVSEGRRVAYSHTDVSIGNQASRRVFEKMGAIAMWRVAWIEIDLEFEDEDGKIED